MIHILPHWNFADGEEVHVMTHTNCSEAELFLNGKSLGKKNVDKYDMADWFVPFEKGTLKMVGYIDGKEVCSDEVSTANAAKKIIITPQNEFVYDSCDDAVIFNISVIDENGVSVPTADNLIKFTADGGEIIGSDGMNFSVVFQEDRLFPSLTALGNVSLVSDETTARRLLDLVGLHGSEDKYPDELSGGMSRRVAIARALAYGGDALILDEPFKGLESELKEHLAS